MQQEPLATPGKPAARDTLGCSFSKLRKNQEFSRFGLQLFRKGSDADALGQVETAPADRGYLIGVSTRAGHRRRIFHSRHASLHDFDAGWSYIRNFEDDYKADMYGAFDFLLLEIDTDYMNRAVQEAGGKPVDGLMAGAGLNDPLLANLVNALQPTLDRPEEASALFVDQLGIAISLHLAQRYGSNPMLSQSAGQLTRRQQRIACDLMLGSFRDQLSIADVAEACALSRSHFIRAFRQTMGETPHRWVLRKRVEQASRMVREGSLPLNEIATLCGFVDQSHLTRKFTEIIGLPPAKWRRQIM